MAGRMKTLKDIVSKRTHANEDAWREQKAQKALDDVQYDHEEDMFEFICDYQAARVRARGS